MYAFFALKRVPRHIRLSVTEDREIRDAFLIVLLLIGVLLGALIGSFVESTSFAIPESLLLSEDHTASFTQAFWEASKYFLLLLVCTTSYLGLLIIPALLLLRGYTLACAVAAVYAVEKYHGLLAALFISGIPALLTIPPMVILASDCFVRSCCLLQLRLSRRTIPMQPYHDFRHWFFAAAMIAADIVYIYLLRPHFLMLL